VNSRLTAIARFDLTIHVKAVPAISLSQDQRQEVACWIEQNQSTLPEAVRLFLAPHQKYLAAGGDLRRAFDEVYRELRRALGITRSSERRRSGKAVTSPAGGGGRQANDARGRLEQQLDRSARLGDWHGDLRERHEQKVKRIQDKLAKMETAPVPKPPSESPSAPEQERQAEQQPQRPAYSQEVTEDTPLEEIELTEQQRAACRKEGEEFAAHLVMGDGVDPALQSVNETLMPGGAVVTTEQVEQLVAEMPDELRGATVVKTLSDKRVRYDISVSVNRIELDVHKQVVVTPDGQRSVISAPTDAYGPPRYSVTWSSLATLAILVGQFALPLNRLATLFSAVGKQFSAGGLSRMLHYVAERLVPIYLTLSEQLADSEILGGDDTSCRVLEVTQLKQDDRRSTSRPPPWADYRTRAAAEQSIEQCRHRRQARMQRRAEGDRDAKPSPDEQPTLGMLIGRLLEFESPLVNGHGPKQSLNTTVLSGRADAKDPQSLIVLYRSHLGGCGNLLESILQRRSPSAGDLILQADLSKTNLIRDPELLKRFNVRLIGCSAHARRPFAQNEDEDSVYCSYMLHLFAGLAMHEERLDVHGRNRDNVLAVRQAESRRLWEHIRELATLIKQKWSKGTKLGTAARYLLNHYEELTAYLDDPRLEPTNNLQERLLRTEKLIENSSMFRRTLEGRFVLDVVRTILQTAVAAGAPVHHYLESVLRTDSEEISDHPERFTPRAWITAKAKETSTQTSA
jgi:hypothetical protein